MTGRAERATPPGATPNIGDLAVKLVERGDRVADQVYRNLRQAILAGEIGPRSRLREVEVAAALQVSRTPVREAISRLIGDRLVRELPKGGVEVSDPSVELFEIYCIREALEVCAGRLAATRVTPEQLARLDALVRAGAALKAGDFAERTRINEEFHRTIVEAAGSPRLSAMVSDFREFFASGRWLGRNDQLSASQALQDHRDIVEALRRHAPRRVERLIQQHLKAAYAKLLDNHRVSDDA